MLVGAARRHRNLVICGTALWLGISAALAQQCPEGFLFVADSRGVADIVAGGEEAARDRAIRNAERFAIQQLGVRIEATTLIVDLELVEDVIRSETPGRYVQMTDIVEEGSERSSYFVVVDTCVSEQEVRAELESIGAIVRQDLGNPQIVVLAHDGDGAAVAETARDRVHDHFVDLGFNVTDDEESADMVVRVGADSTTVPTTVGDLFSARVALRFDAALSTGQAVVGWPVPSAGPKVSGSPEQAAQNALTETLSEEVLNELTNRVIAAMNTTFEIVVRGLPDFASFEEFGFILESVRGVDDIQPESYTEGTGTFSGTGSARTRDIAARLEGSSLERHPDLRLEVSSVSKFRVEFAFVE